MRISDWSSDVCSSDLDGPKAVRDYLRLKLMAERNEVFVAVFLNSQHQVLACEPLFKGTVSEASVYPRVVVQRALELNASALIFSHQHPSGTTEQIGEHTSELKSLMRISYAVFCLKKKNTPQQI